MTKLLLASVVCVSLLGCVHSERRVESLGIAKGDMVVLNADAIVSTCSAWNNQFELLFSAPRSTPCLLAASTAEVEAGVGILPKGTELKVVKIMSIGAVDAHYMNIYLRTDSISDRLYVNGKDWEPNFIAVVADET